MLDDTNIVKKLQYLQEGFYRSNLQIMRLLAIEEADIRVTLKLARQVLNALTNANSYLLKTKDEPDDVAIYREHWLEIRELAIARLVDIADMMPGIIAENSITCNMHQLLACSEMSTNVINTLNSQIEAMVGMQEADADCLTISLTDRQEANLVNLGTIDFESMFNDELTEEARDGEADSSSIASSYEYS